MINFVEDITVMSTEIIEEEEEEEKHEDQEEVKNPVKSDVKEDSPVPPDEAEKLLKIVEDHEKQEVNKKYLIIFFIIFICFLLADDQS